MSQDEWKLIDRFKEPSSWAGLAAGLGALGVSVPAGIVQGASLVGAGICVLLSVILKEGGQ